MTSSHTRRHYLAVVGGGILAGCAGGDDAQSASATEDRPTRSARGTGTVQSGGEATERGDGPQSFSERRPLWRGNHRRTGAFPENTAPETRPELRGVYAPLVDATNPDVSAPVVTESLVIYVVEKRLVAVDRQTLERRWEREEGLTRSSDGLVVSDDTVFSWHVAVDISTGERLWLHEGSRWGTSPIVTDSALYVNGYTIVDRETGAVEREGVNGSFVPPASYHDGTIYFDSGYGGTGAYEVATETERWSGPPDYREQQSYGTPVVGDSLVYHDINGDLYAYDRADGTVRWTRNVDSSTYLGGVSARVLPIYSDDRLLVSDGGLSSLDAETGETLQTEAIDGVWLLAGDTLVAHRGNGIDAFDGQSFDQRWRLDFSSFAGQLDADPQLSYSSLAVADGEIYVTFPSGELAVFAGGG